MIASCTSTAVTVAVCLLLLNGQAHTLLGEGGVQGSGAARHGSLLSSPCMQVTCVIPPLMHGTMMHGIRLRVVAAAVADAAPSRDGATVCRQCTSEGGDARCSIQLRIRGGSDIQPSPVPDGWVEVFHEPSGRSYFYEESTNTTQWERPEEDGQGGVEWTRLFDQVLQKWYYYSQAKNESVWELPEGASVVRREAGQGWEHKEARQGWEHNSEEWEEEVRRVKRAQESSTEEGSAGRGAWARQDKVESWDGREAAECSSDEGEIETECREKQGKRGHALTSSWEEKRACLGAGLTSGGKTADQDGDTDDDAAPRELMTRHLALSSDDDAAPRELADDKDDSPRHLLGDDDDDDSLNPKLAAGGDDSSAPMLGDAARWDAPRDAEAMGGLMDKVEPQQLCDVLASEVILQGHYRTVSCLAHVQDGGDTLLSGGQDGDLRTYEYGKVQAKMRSTHCYEPQGGYAVESISVSPFDPGLVLVATGFKHASLFRHNRQRRGKRMVDYIYGNQWLANIENTVGHVGALTCAFWHPWVREKSVTASVDGTIRVWDVSRLMLGQDVLLDGGRADGKRHAVRSAAACPGGSALQVLGLYADGRLRLWDTRESHLRPTRVVKHAHLAESKGGQPMCVRISPDGAVAASYGGEGATATVRLWDFRMLEAPTHEEAGVVNGGSGNSVISFCPTSRLLAYSGQQDYSGQQEALSIGASARGSATLADWTGGALRTRKTLSVSSGVVSCIDWGHESTEFVCGTNGGRVHVFYDASGAKGAAALASLGSPQLKELLVQRLREPARNKLKGRPGPESMFSNLDVRGKDGHLIAN